MSAIHLPDDIVNLIFRTLPLEAKSRLSLTCSQFLPYFLSTLDYIPGYACINLFHQPKFIDIFPRVFGHQETFSLCPFRKASLYVFIQLLKNFYCNRTVYIVIHNYEKNPYCPDEYRDNDDTWVICNNLTDRYTDIIVFTSKEELHNYFSSLEDECILLQDEDGLTLLLSINNNTDDGNHSWTIIDPPPNFVIFPKIIADT